MKSMLFYFRSVVDKVKLNFIEDYWRESVSAEGKHVQGQDEYKNKGFWVFSRPAIKTPL